MQTTIRAMSLAQQRISALKEALALLEDDSPHPQAYAGRYADFVRETQAHASDVLTIRDMLDRQQHRLTELAAQLAAQEGAR